MDRRILVVGSGRMGTQIGLEYAMAGFRVGLVARDIPALRVRLHEAVELWLGRRPLDREALDVAAAKTELMSTVGHCTNEVDILIESLPEDVDLKVSVLRQAASIHSEAILATNTSSLDIGALGESIGAADRTIGTHYLNPPILNPLVEVVPSEATSQTTTKYMLNVLALLGKRPILVRNPMPGFVWNRLQFALLREALHLVEIGAVSASEIDEIMELGLGRRWRAVGPMKSVALGGSATFIAAAPRILESLSDREDLDGLIVVLDDMALDLEALRRVRDATLAQDLPDVREREQQRPTS